MALTDYCVGKINQSLIDLGIEENTILIFSSDNGPRPGINEHQSASKLRGYKGQIFEGGHRVPLIVRWPNKIKSRTESNETVCMKDFMATFASILNYELPNSAGEDSYDISQILFNKKYQSPLRESTVHHSGAGAFAIRKGDWKIIFGNVEHGEMPDDPENWKKRGSLFNLKDDAYETNNVYGEHPSIIAEMNAILDNYLNE